MDVSKFGAAAAPAPGYGQALMQPGSVAGWTPQERGFKVFISYSRGDSAEFAAALVKALERQGLAARLDTRDLEFGEKWQAQLKDFIRQADAVVYVVSPRSIASKWCRWELAQVAAQSKRLVPVVHLEVKPEELPAEIGEIQLFNARPGVDYAAGDEATFAGLAGRLAEGLQKDRAWLQEHTRLTDLAHAWAQHGKTRDHLLWGRALKNAELWMARRPKGAPPPSRAQLDFIASSQAAAQTSARRWVIGLSAATAGAVALAAMAWIQRQAAIERQNQALANESRMLVGMSQRATASGDAVEGAQLALAALPQSKADQRPYVAEAERALYAALQEQRERAVIADATGARMMRGHFSPDGKRAFALSEVNRLTIANAASGEIEVTTPGTPLLVTDAVWSADGRRGIGIAMRVGDNVNPSETGVAVIWDLESGKEIALIDHQLRELSSAALRSDGKEVVLTYERDKVFIHDTADGAELAVISVPATDETTIAALSPDGKLLATAALDGTIRVWDRQTKSEIKTLEGHTFRIHYLTFTSDSGRLISGSSDGTARIWEIVGGSEPVILTGHADLIAAAALSRDETHLVTGSQDKTARIWNLADPTRPRVLDGHQGTVDSVRFTSDGKWVLTAAADGTARIWDAATGKNASVLRGHEDALTSAAVSPDGSFVLTTGGPTARIWSVASQADGTVLPSDKFAADPVFNADGSRIVAETGDGKATLWDVASRQPVAVLDKHGQRMVAAAFSADGESLVTIGWDETAQRWNAKTGAHIGEIARGLDNWGGKSLLDAAGTRLVAASDQSSAAFLWDLDSGQRLTSLAPPNGGEAFKNVSTAAFSPDGSRLATVASYSVEQTNNLSTYGNGTSVWVWDARTGQSLRELQAGSSPIVAVEFGPGSANLAAVSRDGVIRLWDVASGRELRQFNIDTKGLGGISTTLAFSPTGALLAAASKNAGRIWNPKTGSLVSEISTLQRQLGRVTFSPDGRILATTSREAVRVWNPVTGAEIATFPSEEPRSVDIAFSPDGALLALTRSRPGVALLPLYPSYEDLVPAARLALPRCLSRARAQSLGLGLGVPRWCITGPHAARDADPGKWSGKWPYDSAPWREWLAATDRGENPGLPAE